MEKSYEPQALRESSRKKSSGEHFGYDPSAHEQHDATNDTNNTHLIRTEQWISRSKFRKQKLKLQKQNPTIIFNYSTIKLTEPMEKVLNRGLNFCILPPSLDITQVLANFRQFERSMVWQEFWYGRENEMKTIPIFRLNKTNFPRNHQIPKNLRTCLNSIKSEIMDPLNRNPALSNLPSEEVQAIKELIRLQRERIITIKLCDKGAGIIVTNFSEYVKACMKHLESKQSENKPYYEKVNKEHINKSMKDINMVLEEACNNKLITHDEFKAMNTDNKNVCKFYANFKVHKDHNHGELPEIRPIVSGCGSYLENVALYVEHHIKHEATKHASNLKDTPNFLRELEELKQKGPLPKNSMVFVTDVSALFTNILRKEGLQTTRKALNERINPEVPT